MNIEDFYDSGIYIAVVAAAFVLVMLLIVLIGKIMGGSKKSGRKKKAGTPIKREVIPEQESGLSMFNSEPVQASPVVSGTPANVGGNNTGNADTQGSNSGKVMSLADNIPKPEIEALSGLNTQDVKSPEVAKIAQPDIKIELDEDDNDDIKDDNSDLDFFNVESVEQDNMISELAADLADVDLDTLGELTKEISQIILSRK